MIRRFVGCASGCPSADRPCDEFATRTGLRFHATSVAVSLSRSGNDDMSSSGETGRSGRCLKNRERGLTVDLNFETAVRNDGGFVLKNFPTPDKGIKVAGTRGLAREVEKGSAVC